MTTIITRLYETERKAKDVAQTLMDEGYRRDDVDVMTAMDPKAIEAAGVARATAAAYAGHGGSGTALLLVKAPFGTARQALQLLADTGAIDIGSEKESAVLKTEMSRIYQTEVLTDHPKFMTNAAYPATFRGRSFIARMFGRELTDGSRIALRRELEHGPSPLAKRLPYKLLSDRTPANNAVMRDHRLWSDRIGLPVLTARRGNSP